MDTLVEKRDDEVVLGSDLGKVQERFRRWREVRKRGARIPRELWQAAISLAPRYSYYKIARALGLDYVDVRRRAEAAGGPTKDGRGDGPAFVELRLPGISTLGECRLRAEDGRGRKVELELKGVGVKELVQLLGGLWSESS